MKNLIKIFSFFLILQLLYVKPALSAEYFDDSEVMHIDYPKWFEDSPFTDLSEELEQAVSAGKKGLMVLFITEGCSYCEIFIKKSLKNPEIAAIVQDSFDTIGLEIFDDKEMTDPKGNAMPIKQFANNEQVEYSPTLLFYDADGDLVLRAVGYQSTTRFRKILDYVSGEHYRSVTFRDYLAQQPVLSPAEQTGGELIKDPLFIKPPYALDRSNYPAQKPLLVIFEKKDCEECVVFHRSVLASKDVRETLGRYEVARFDKADTGTPVISPAGEKTRPATWYGQTGFTRVPALMFFDENGEEVLRTDALVLRQRMMNSLNFVLERAYKKGWTYQRFARTKGAEKRISKMNKVQKPE